MLHMQDSTKQVYIYSLTTDSFYNDEEDKIHRKQMKCYRYRDLLKGYKEDVSKHKTYNEKRIKKLKSELQSLLKSNDGVRHLRSETLTDSKIISLFDSVLTRTLGIKEHELTEDIIVVERYYEDVLKDILFDGFIHNGEKYIYFTSSAGQIRKKRTVFIKESVYKKHEKTLMCGLTEESINEAGGINTNKFQAYQALTFSATNEWVDFDVDKAIVVNDLETNVKADVDYIDMNTYEVTRKQMEIPIEHTDGCGMVLPSVSTKSFMIRLPWVKGLLAVFDFRKFAEEHGTYMVTDIYGKKHDVRDVEIIFTKSQFKLHKFYKSWKEYQDNFKKYRCQAAILNPEDTSNNARLNYQMLQTLSDITDDELNHIAHETFTDIENISTQEVMMRIMGADKPRTSYQHALNKYPALLNDDYSKEMIKDNKKSLVKEARQGKLKINGKYTYAIPDLYAFSEYLFGMEPKGLLQDGEVYTSLYGEDKLDVLRSPHLYREHAVRQNVKHDELKKWFITEGIYTSIQDPISKLLQFDNDGDKLLVTPDQKIVEVAERNMKDIVPLYYEMAKAPAQQINAENIYNSLLKAHKANIGEVSNNITKIWNSPVPDIEAVKYLTAENNFVIDYAKTLYMPERPDFIHERIKNFTKRKVPYFFKYVKDKPDSKVETINESPINRLSKMVPNKRIHFKQVAGKFDYKLLMKRSRVNPNEELIEKYKELNQKKRHMMNSEDEQHKHGNQGYVYHKIRNELLQYGKADYVADVLIQDLYTRKSVAKQTLWECFGKQILGNMESNLDKAKQCEHCNSLFRQKTNMQTKCEECQNRSKMRVKKTKKALEGSRKFKKTTQRSVGF